MNTTTRTTTSTQRNTGNQKQQVRPAPQRTCVACRRAGDQSSFVRLVRVTDEAGTRIEVDEGRRRLPGRGAYLCRDAGCWERGLRGALSGSLRTPITAANREALHAYAARFASTSPSEASTGEDSGQHESEDA